MKIPTVWHNPKTKPVSDTTKCDNCNSTRIKLYYVLSEDRLVTYARYRCRECGNDDYAD